MEVSEKQKAERQSRQFELDQELEGFTIDETRTARQTSAASLEEELLGFERDEICERTGFESRKREECKVWRISLTVELTFDRIFAGGERH